LVTTTCRLCPDDQPCDICIGDLCFYKIAFIVRGPGGPVCGAPLYVNGRGTSFLSMDHWQLWPGTDPTQWLTGTNSFSISDQDVAHYCNDPKLDFIHQR
jgi:hypothetical protein